MGRISTTPRRVVLARLSALGDIVQTMPVACALRRALPEIHLTWVVQSSGAPLLEGHRAVDRVVTVPRRWMGSLGEMVRIRRLLQAGDFDLGIDGQGLAKSALLVWLSGAPRRIGFAPPWGRELSPWLMTETVATSDFGHIIERNLRLLEPLGIVNPMVEFDLPVFPEARRTLLSELNAARIAPGGILLNVGAAWPSKRWPSERFGRLARQLADRYGTGSVVVYGSAEERAMAERAVAASDGAAALAPSLTLRQLAELARTSRLCVSADTGPLHIAAAVDTPCVGLYGPFPAERHGPYGPRHRTVQKVRLGGSVRARRRASPACMEAIDVESVFAACAEVIEGSR